jgi:hypothetical protein
LTQQSNPRRAEHFDEHFTKVPVTFTPPDDQIIMNLTGREFAGFSFKNPFFHPELTLRHRGGSLNFEAAASVVQQTDASRRTVSMSTQDGAFNARADIFFDF